MSYQIIARKYRPENFDQLIGQEKTVVILKHSIERSKIGQSYLFTGPRGVGKTTLARIIAKCLNCDKGMSVSPCNQCENCLGIQQGYSLDYEEIDGASNRGIDEIRNLKSNLAYAASPGKHRVVIIDEVHMLTEPAFNALLKTLEEPPAKTIFILCTTEKHKLPMTIRSRCQQFQFDRVAIELIEKHLIHILNQEKIGFEEGSLFPIAKKADGSVRDSENLLEQAIAYAEGEITVSEVMESLGELSTERKFVFIKNLISNKLIENEALIHQFSIEGVNFEQFLFDINEYLTAIIYLKSGIKDHHLLEISKSDWTEIVELESQLSLSDLFLLTDMIYQFIKDLKSTINERLSILYFLTKLHRYPNLISNEMLKEDLKHLAKYYLEPDKKDDEIEEIKSQPQVDIAKLESEAAPPPEAVRFPNPKVEIDNIASEPKELVINYKKWFENWRDELKNSDLTLHHVLLNYDFIETRNEGKQTTLVLYNKGNASDERLLIHQNKVLSLMNESMTQGQFSEIVINENVFQHNLKAIEDNL